MGAAGSGYYGAAMFTGLITDIGEVRSVERPGDTRFVIGTHYELGTVEIGASIAHSGACLTVVEKGEDWFAVDVSQETLDCTTLGDWAPGRRINLEQSLRLGAELGGHLVQGHVERRRHFKGGKRKHIILTRAGPALSYPRSGPKGAGNPPVRRVPGAN